LTSEERSGLKDIIKEERMAEQKRRNDRILIKDDQGTKGPEWKDADIDNDFDCTTKSVERLRKRMVEHGLEAAMDHGNRGSYRAKKLDGVAEAHLIATACSSAPQGRNRWTVRLLAEQMVALGFVDSCSKSTVHNTLKKTNLSLI